MVALFAGCGGPKLDAPAAASKFFELLGKKEIRQAYESSAFSFQSTQTLKTFEYTVQALGMQNHAGVAWTRQVVGAREAKLDGETVTPDGKKQKVTVVMIRESGRWKLHSLRPLENDESVTGSNPFTLVGKGASFNDSFRRALPPQKEINQIVLAAILEFNEAIQKGEFGDFYKSTAPAWQAQLTERKLKNAFQGFIDAGVKLDGVKSVEPVFEPAPQINGEGLLVVSGFYPTTPNQVVFSMKFAYVLPHWKLFGLDVNLVKP